MNPVPEVAKRLSSLRPRRRVGVSPDVLEGLEPETADVSGTQGENLPVRDVQAGGLTPESYDVRANQSAPSEQQQPKSFWTKLGEDLALQRQQIDAARNPENPEEPGTFSNIINDLMTQRQQIAGLRGGELGPMRGHHPYMDQEAQAPEVPTQEPVSPGLPDYQNLGKSLLNVLSPSMSSTIGLLQEEGPNLIKNISEGKFPAFEKAKEEENTLTEDQKRFAEENGTPHIVYGATGKVASMPELQAKVSQVIGQDFSGELAENTKAIEKVLADLSVLDQAKIQGLDDLVQLKTQEIANYDEQEARIAERIKSNSATDMDKYYIGLALLMPALVAAIGGGEAGLGALAGGAKGITDILGARQKQIGEDEELLAGITKNKQAAQLAGQELELGREKFRTETGLKKQELQQQATKLGNEAKFKKAELQLEGLKTHGQFEQNLPKDVNAHLVGRDRYEWTNLETGEQDSGTELMPGLVARSDFVTNKDDVTFMKNQAKDIAEFKTAVVGMNDITSALIEIADQLEDKNAFVKAATGYLSGSVPGATSLLTQDVIVNGKKVNAGTAIKNYIGQYIISFAKLNGLGQVDAPVLRLTGDLINNPTTTLLSPEDFIDQILQVDNHLTDNLYESAKNKGFEPYFLLKDIQKNRKQMFERMNETKANKRSTSALRG